MNDLEQRPVSRHTPLSLDLLRFYDDFAEFHHYCAFLCDAVSSIATDQEVLDAATIQGLSRYSGWIKRRIKTLKSELSVIHKKSRAQAKSQKNGDKN